MNKIFKVNLKKTNAFGDTAQNQLTKKYIDVENGDIFVLEKDIEYVFANFDVRKIEYVGLFFKLEED